MQSRPKYPWLYSLYLMSYYTSTAVYQGFIPVYFKSIGLDTRIIGALLSFVPLVSIFTQPFWGMVGDRMSSKNKLLRIIILGAAIFIMSYAISPSFLWLLPMVCLFATFHTAIQPLGDSIILEALSVHNHPFGPVRLLGTIAFAVASIIFGQILNKDIALILPFSAGILLLTGASSFFLPLVKGHQSGGKKMPIYVIFNNPQLVQLLVFVAILQITMGFFYTYFPIHFKTLPGSTNALLGWAYFISAMSEVPFLLVSDKLFRKIGVGKLLAISSVVLTLRWVLLYFERSPYVAMGTQVLHGWGFIVMIFAMSKYINLAVPDELKASGQLILGMVGFGIARGIGIFGGGFVAESIGIPNGFLICGIMTFVALLTFGIKFLKMPPVVGE